MSGIKVIAIAGASGYVGRPIVDELLKAGVFELRILTRKSAVRKLSILVQASELTSLNFRLTAP